MLGLGLSSGDTASIYRLILFDPDARLLLFLTLPALSERMSISPRPLTSAHAGRFVIAHFDQSFAYMSLATPSLHPFFTYHQSRDSPAFILPLPELGLVYVGTHTRLTPFTRRKILFSLFFTIPTCTSTYWKYHPCEA